MPNDPKQQKPEPPAGSSTVDSKKVRDLGVQKEDASKVKAGTRRVGDPCDGGE